MIRHSFYSQKHPVKTGVTNVDYSDIVSYEILALMANVIM